MPSDFVNQLALAWPLSQWQRVPIVVAVSGGADSVALLRGLVEIAGGSTAGFVVTHFDHQLRDDSSEDAQFVQQLSEQIGVRCRVGCAGKDLNATNVGSIEHAARDARYSFLTRVAQEVGARYIATAHTADDQTETILHRIIRGTGLRGLAGIPPSRELVKGITLVRPMLTIRRETVVGYLRGLRQDFCSDATNKDERFTRNRIRRSLLPLLRQDFNTNVDQVIQQLGQVASETNELVEELAEEAICRCAVVDTGSVFVDVVKLVGLKPIVVRAMLRRIWQQQGWSAQAMSFGHWCALETLALADFDSIEQTVVILPSDVRAERSANQLTLKAKGQPKSADL